MTPDVVVDVGNTRIKWGLVRDGRVVAPQAAPHGRPDLWGEAMIRVELSPGSLWVLTGVHPGERDRLGDWLLTQGQQVMYLKRAGDLPLGTALAEPDRAGIDRLLDAVAVNTRREPGRPAVIADAGSAVTVDYLDEQGIFQGGAIFPGMRLMAEALHSYTALLPRIDPPREVPGAPGRATIPAMELGVFWAVAGGIRSLVDRYTSLSRTPPEVYLTGGDAQALSLALGSTATVWTEMTLEGVRIAAEALP